MYSPVRRRRVRLVVARHRRLLAAGAAAAAVASAVQTLSPGPAPTRPVWVAARDLPAGHALTGGDLRRQSWPVAAVPDGSRQDGPSGVLAGPVRRGEPVTDVRLVGPGLLTGQDDGTVAVTVRVSDPAATLAVQVGGRVDVLALPPIGSDGGPAVGPAITVASAALVLTLPGSAGPGYPGPDPDSGAPSSGAPGSGGLGSGVLGGPAVDVGGAGDGSSGGVLLLAVDRATAAELAAAQSTSSLTVVIR